VDTVPWLRRGEHQVDQPELDPEALLARLKAEHRTLLWEPLPPEKQRRFTDVSQARNKASLEYLHHHWALPDSFDAASGGGGFRGKLVALFGRLTFRVLSPYLRDERALLSHMVRVNEALERRCDDLILRCEQLSYDMASRQADEAENQAKLALWLHLDPPRTGTGGAAANGRDGRAVTGDTSSSS
jgi:hypothetical protein